MSLLTALLYSDAGKEKSEDQTTSTNRSPPAIVPEPWARTLHPACARPPELGRCESSCTLVETPSLGFTH